MNSINSFNLLNSFGYSVKKVLSRKDNCECYEVKEEKIKMIRAIKIYEENKISEENKDRYKHCLEVLKQLAVYNMCGTEEIKEESEYIMIIMKKYSNSLENINPTEYFEDIGIEHLLKSVCECIHLFHYNGLVHGNLKPSNIFVDEDGNFKFTDYFCSYLRKSSKKDINEICYSSPEILKNEEINDKSDIWAIGCLIYYLKSGRRMFEGESVNDVMIKVLKSEYVALDCEFSELLNLLIDKLMKVNPNERISISELEVEIDKIQSEECLPVIEFSKIYKEKKEKGNDLYKVKEYSKAIEIYSNALEYVSNIKEEFEIKSYIGKCKYMLEDNDESLKIFTALRQSEIFLSLNDSIKCVICRFKGKCEYKNNNYEMSLESYKESDKYRLRENDSIKCDILLYIGKNNYKLKRYNESLAVLIDSLKYKSVEDNMKCDVYRFIGSSYYYIGKYDKSLEALKLALQFLSEENEVIERDIQRFIDLCHKKLEDI